jgi:hypothetical protein
MGKTRTSRTVCIWIPTVKREVNGWQDWLLGRADRPPGPREPSAWAPRTIRGQIADRPPGPPSCTLFGSVLKRITDRPQEARGLSAWKRIFSKTFAKNLTYKINIKNPRTVRPKGPDCPPNTWKLIFLKISKETLLPREIATHLNAMHANSWSKWYYGKSSQWNWSLLIVRLSILSSQSFNIF